MRKKILSCFIAALCTVYCNAQFTDDFSDGDFTNNPAWIGGVADWIVNAGQQLQSNNAVASSSFYLSTSSSQATTAQWPCTGPAHKMR